MKLPVLSFLHLIGAALCDSNDRQPLAYAAVPSGTYVAPKAPSTTSLLDFVKSRSDLSSLASVLEECAGFAQAFDAATSWKFTFFAPSNKAFNNTGAYFSTFAATPKGKWWLGNVLQHHYIPNSQLKLSSFNSTVGRLQTGTFLYISAQDVGGEVILNGVSTITKADISVTNGVVHIIDHILDPSAQILQPDLPKISQAFIPGSCSNPALPYC